MTTVAFIGLGAMGSRIAANLLQAGFTLKVYNRDRAKTAPLAAKGAAVADSPAGLDRDATVEILGEGAAGCRLTKTKLPKMLKRDFAPQFQVALMDKDMRYFLDMAQTLDRPTPIAALVRSQYQAARRNDLGKLDTAAVFLQVAGERPKS